jgi:hypothetical protein
MTFGLGGFVWQEAQELDHKAELRILISQEQRCVR